MDDNSSFGVPVNGYLPQGSLPPQMRVPTAPVGTVSRTARELWLRYVHMSAIGTKFYRLLDPIVCTRFEAEIAARRWFFTITDLRREAVRLQLPLTPEFLADQTPFEVIPGWAPTQDTRCQLIRFADELARLFDRNSVEFWQTQPGEQLDDPERQARLAVGVAEGVLLNLRQAVRAQLQAGAAPSVEGNLTPPAPTSVTPDAPDAVLPCPVRLIEDAAIAEYRVVVSGVAGAQPNGVAITFAMYNVLKALVAAFPGGLSSNELKTKSGVLDPGKSIREAMDREPALREVIHTPKVARRNVPGVYRIKPARTRTVQTVTRA